MEMFTFIPRRLGRLTIAILDDDLEEIRKIQSLILNIEGDYQIHRFQAGHALLEAIQSGKRFDLLFCDVFMKEENGLNVAREVHRVSPQTGIAFITYSREHAVEAIAMDVLHYLVKPVRQEDIVEVFRRLEKKAEPRHALTIQINKTINIVYQDEIIRVETHLHNTVITCVGDKVYSTRQSFSSIYEALDDSFIQIKKNLVLNMHHIVRMTFRECVSRDGCTFLLRRDQAKEIREKYHAFVRRELAGGQ